MSHFCFFLLSAEDSGSRSKYSVYHVFSLILCLTLVQCLISALLSAEDFGSCSKYSVYYVFCLMVPCAQEWSHSIFVETKYQCSTHCPSVRVSGDKAPAPKVACMHDCVCVHVCTLFSCVCVCVCVCEIYILPGFNMLLHKCCIYMLRSNLVFWCLRNVCFIVIFIDCFKWLVSQKNNVCVCVCAYVHTYVRTLLLLSILHLY